MKKNKFLILFVVGALVLTACRADDSISDAANRITEEKMPEPEFPLDKDTIMGIVDELGLPCVISEDESQESLSRENAIYSNYTLRDPERKFSEDSPVAALYCGLISGIVDGGRYLSASFDARSHMLNDKPFDWEDWKEEIVFITTLYGGFKDEKEVYRALSGIEVPDDGSGFREGVQLSHGYCGVQKSKNSPPPASGGYVIWFNFYETEELYLKAEQDKKEAYEKALEDNKRRRDEYLENQDIRAVETNESIEHMKTNTKIYLLKDGREGFVPQIILNENDCTFQFSYDVLSSYLTVGTYTKDNGQLELKTDDGKYHYTFDITDDHTLKFDQGNSSDIKILMGEGIQDGAEFICGISDAPVIE